MEKFKTSSQGLLNSIMFLLAFLVFSCENNEEVQPKVLANDQLDGVKQSKTSLYYGPAAEVGDGTARVWVQTEQGKPVAIGIELSEEVLVNLPEHGMPMEFILKLPGQAHATGYKTITVGWNPMGHEPDHIYTLPHFDFHFYMQTEGQIMQIEGGIDPGAYILLEKGILPGFYGFGPPGAPPFAVPHMGLHWVNFTSPEFQPGGVFSKTFIYGSDHDKITFLEPMITLAFLQSLPEGTEDVSVVPALNIYEDPGYYPATYTISHLENGSYSIALTGLEWHNRHR